MRQLLILLLCCSIPSNGRAQYSESHELQSLERFNTDISGARRRADDDIYQQLNQLQQLRGQQTWDLRNRLDRQQRLIEIRERQQQQRLMEIQERQQNLENLFRPPH